MLMKISKKWKVKSKWYIKSNAIIVSIELGISEELRELKAQILSIEGTSSKRELELANQKLKGRDSHSTIYF